MPLLNRETLVKVPEITFLFWIAKLATTCFGEAFSDYVFFNDYIGRTVAILMGLALILVCYAIQITTKKYIPLIYWLAVTAVAIFGTMSADFLNKDLGMSLTESTILLLVLQAAVFFAWWRTEGTLDVHSITTTRREIFYWLTVYLTFSLGTAAGDFVSGTLAFGTLDSTLIFLGIILIPLIAWKYFGLNVVLAFWLAYTITRPLGASFGDYLAVPAPYGDGAADRYRPDQPLFRYRPARRYRPGRLPFLPQAQPDAGRGGPGRGRELTAVISSRCISALPLIRPCGKREAF